jgi:RNA recognition motif-containing protein
MRRRLGLAACEEQTVGRKLYVGNLPYQVQESELEQLFAQAGSVASVFVPRDKFTGQGRGFAFVEMNSDAEAQSAIEKFHEQPRRRSMKVSRRVPRNSARSAAAVVAAAADRSETEPRW